MSSVILLQNTSGSVASYLELSAGGAATGLTFSDVSVDIKKEGENTFSAKTVDGTNFTEVGGGVYQIVLSSADTDTLGNLYIRITGGTIKTALVSSYVAATAPVSPSNSISINTTSLFGYVFDLEGSPVQGASVSARVLATPSLGASTDDYVLSDALVTAKTDSDGFFTITLTSGAQVDFFIPAAGYRRTLQVPSTSKNVFDIV